MQGAVMALRTAEGTSTESKAENNTLTGTFRPVPDKVSLYWCCHKAKLNKFIKCLKLVFNKN